MACLQGRRRGPYRLLEYAKNRRSAGIDATLAGR